MDQTVVKRKIYLVGMMGSGKSFWAGKLGHHFILPAYDLDKLIEHETGKTIREIFEEEGEDGIQENRSQVAQAANAIKEVCNGYWRRCSLFFG